MTSIKATAKPNRLAWIEWVRGIAALLVAVHHLIQPISPSYRLFAENSLNFGRVGVVAFFLVSGFVIPLSYARQTTDVFLVRRASRLYPLYWLVLVITVLVAGDLRWGDTSWWLNLALNATMLQSLFGTAIVGVAWTLTIEWLYYLQQIGFKSIRLLEQSWKFGYVWLLAYFALLGMEHQLNRELPISVPMLLSVACLGHAFSLYLLQRIRRKTMLVFSLTMLGGGIGGALLRANVDVQWPGYLYAVSSAGGIVLFAIAYLLRDRLRLPWALWLGSISYALYLVHSLFLYPIEAASSDFAWIVAACAIAASILVSWILHLYVEQPFMRLGRMYKPR